MLTVEEIISEDEFQTLYLEWDHLLQETEEYSPFLTHDWFRCCIRAYGNQKLLFVLTVKDGANLVGIAPLWRYFDNIRGLKVRRIDFIIVPDTPYIDIIALPQRRREILEAMLGYLKNERKGTWDVLTFGQLPVQSPNFNLFREILKDVSGECLNGSSVTPYVPIKGDWASFIQAKSARFRKTQRNIINRVKKLGNVEIECIQRDPTGVVLKEVIAVAGKSWKAREGIAVSSGNETRRFFAALTEVAGLRNWLLVWLMKVNGASVATEYDLSYGGKVYALRADYNEAYGAHSPGAYLQYEIIKWLFENGYREYSTGPGINNYKLHWAEQSRKNVLWSIHNSSYKGRLVWVLESGVLPFLRGIRAKSTWLNNNKR